MTTTGRGVLGQRILGCLQWSRQHFETHPGPPRWCLSPDDGRHIYQSKVRSIESVRHCSPDLSGLH